MVNLTPAQRALLEEVRVSREAERAAAHTLEARIRAELAERLGTLRHSTALAVRRAVDAGVPIRQVGRDGLGTSDYATARRMLEVTADTSGDQVRTLATGWRTLTDAERAAAGVDPSETAVHIGDRIAVRIPDMDPVIWATVHPDGRPAGQADDDLAQRLETFAA